MFNNTGSFVLRLIGVLLLVGLIIGGGAMAYRAGVAQGIARRPHSRSTLERRRKRTGCRYAGLWLRVSRLQDAPALWLLPVRWNLRIFLFIFLFFGLMRMIFPPLGLALRPHAWTRPLEGPWSLLGNPPWACEGQEDEGIGCRRKEDKDLTLYRYPGVSRGICCGFGAIARPSWG